MGDASSKLHDAIERENLDDIKKVLGKFPDLINQPFSKKGQMTPLLRTVWRGNYKITEWLLDSGADVNLHRNLS